MAVALGFGIFLQEHPEQPFGQLDRAGYAPFGVAIACIILVTSVISALGTTAISSTVFAATASRSGVRERLQGIVDSLRSRDLRLR